MSKRRRRINRNKTREPIVCSPVKIDLLINGKHQYFGFCAGRGALSKDVPETISYIIKFTHLHKSSEFSNFIYLKGDFSERYYGPNVGDPTRFGYSIAPRDWQGFSCSAKYVKQLLTQKIIKVASDV